MFARARLLAFALVGLSVGLAGCKDEPKDERRHEPMRKPGAGKAPAKARGDASAGAETSRTARGQPEPSAETGEAPALAEPPDPDPAIERTLELISTSERQFATSPEPGDEPKDDEGAEERPPEYTAEQFASMLRSKWEWIGYDIVDHELWLDEIATRSFKTNLPYLVVLPDGRRTELRPWLDAQLAKAEAEAEAKQGPDPNK